jgi:DNA-binding CsgD family transcriptional regulator/PAS domain-containing protein
MPDLNYTRLSGLIDPFYEAAARPELWRNLLMELSEVFDSGGATLCVGPISRNTPKIWSQSLDEAIDIGLRTGWLPNQNVRVPRQFNAFRQGRDVVTDPMIFSPWELDHLPFNAEYIASVKARSFASMRLAGEGESTVVLEIERFVGAEPFSTREIEALRLLLPHGQRAGELGLRLAAVQLGGLIDAVSTFSCGALLLDSRGSVLSMNSNAEAMLGPEIFVRGGILTASNKDYDADLQRLMGSVTARGPRHETKPVAAIRISRPGAGDLLVHAAPLARSAPELFERATAIVMIDDLDAPLTPTARVLRQAFGLTSAEAAIATAVSSGRELGEIAHSRGVSLGTLRNQLNTIFAKTGARRQTELVALLLRYVGAT